MQGDGAWNANRRTVPGTGVHLSWEDGTPLPVDQLAPALTREPTVVHTHVTVGGQEPFDALTLYPAGALPGFCRLSVDPDGNNGVMNPPPEHWPGAAIVRGASLARLVPGGEGEARDAETGGVCAGRLTAPYEGARPDTTEELVADDQGIDSGAASAEEAALHVVDDDLPEAEEGEAPGAVG
ncbi:DUF5709 domain-containing protein [Streptomyces sp. NPDC058463]|uniref:DUF5709 domain-containing protein n=1 Tax=Streptomyces sp. NPDC058463 TaxID=3346510 RepID=UPI00365D065C